MNMTYDKLERLRKKIVLKQIIPIILGFVGAITLVIVHRNFYYIMIPIVFGIMFGMILSGSDMEKFTLSYKEYFVLNSIKDVIEVFAYDPQNGFDRGVIENTKMMNMGDTYHSNDYITGKYKNIRFSQSDVHIIETDTETDIDGNTSKVEHTLFNGRWMIFDFNKKFRANIQIAQKGFSNNTLNRDWGDMKYKKVQMESEEFNNKFNVYTQIEHDAFYVITPKMIDTIINLEKECDGKLLFCFVGEKLHIGIYDNRDAFEPGSIYKKIDENRVIESIQKDIKKITSFIDELDLDNDLFV